jgi:hypothetical protein
MLTANPRITQAGLALFTNQDPGFSVALTHVALGSEHYEPDGEETALRAEFARFPITDGADLSPSQIEVGTLITDADPQGNSTANNWVGEIGYYVGSTLLAVQSLAERALFLKPPNLDIPFSYLLDFSSLPPGSLTVGAPKISSDTETAVQSAQAAAIIAGAAEQLIRSSYYGSFAIAPATRPDGSPRQKGDRYFDTADNAEKTWNGAVWYIPNIDTAELAGPSGSDMIGHGTASVKEVLDAHSGAVQALVELAETTGEALDEVNARLAGFVTVKEHGAKGDGVTNDRAAINAAFAAAFAAHRNDVLFDAGTYDLGPLGPGEVAIDLSSYGDGITIRTNGRVRITCTTTGAGASIPIIFKLENNSNFSCDDIEFEDFGYIAGDPWHGAFAFFLNTQAGQNWGNLRFGKIYAKNMLCPLGAAGVASATNRLRGIYIAQIFSDDCYYGFNLQNQGDGVKIGQLIAYQNFRPYYVYGVSDHEVKIYNRKNRGASAAVNISRSPGGLNTTGLKISYVARDMDVTLTHVLINHVDLLGGEISNIEIDIDIRSSIVYAPLRFVNYTGAGGTETAAASPNQVYDIKLSGSCDGQAMQVTAVASYAQKGQLTFKHGRNFYPDQTVIDKFLFGRTLRSYGVVWTAATGGAPAIGNGQLTADIDLVDGVAFNNIKFIPGSTTNFGGGQWQFALPFKATGVAVGSVWILDSGNAYLTGVAKIEPGDSAIQVFTHNSGLSAGSTVPMAWQNGDQMYISIAYPIS